ncbi:hypothetical protein B0H19DRAFT_1084574 [Mycena capillaripes]|nr:hypothetical protein B0H19DRAFT_1084574 [Mycena capillaripes]
MHEECIGRVWELEILKIRLQDNSTDLNNTTSNWCSGDVEAQCPTKIGLQGDEKYRRHGHWAQEIRQSDLERRSTGYGRRDGRAYANEQTVYGPPMLWRTLLPAYEHWWAEWTLTESTRETLLFTYRCRVDGNLNGNLGVARSPHLTRLPDRLPSADGHSSGINNQNTGFETAGALNIDCKRCTKDPPRCPRDIRPQGWRQMFFLEFRRAGGAMQNLKYWAKFHFSSTSDAVKVAHMGTFAKFRYTRCHLEGAETW